MSLFWLATFSLCLPELGDEEPDELDEPALEAPLDGAPTEPAEAAGELLPVLAAGACGATGVTCVGGAAVGVVGGV